MMIEAEGQDLAEDNLRAEIEKMQRVVDAARLLLQNVYWPENEPCCVVGEAYFTCLHDAIAKIDAPLPWRGRAVQATPRNNRR